MPNMINPYVSLNNPRLQKVFGSVIPDGTGRGWPASQQLCYPTLAITWVAPRVPRFHASENLSLSSPSLVWCGRTRNAALCSQEFPVALVETCCKRSGMSNLSLVGSLTSIFWMSQPPTRSVHIARNESEWWTLAADLTSAAVLVEECKFFMLKLNFSPSNRS